MKMVDMRYLIEGMSVHLAHNKRKQSDNVPAMRALYR